METLTQSHIDTIADFLKGKRREKFLASVQVLQDSAREGEWAIKRAKAKAGSGFYQGLRKVDNWRAPGAHSLSYGGPLPEDEQDITDEEIEALGVPVAVGRAWFALCAEAHALTSALESARPRPKLTAIKLSPKVTKTLTEMNLDLDISTIRPADILRVEFSEVDPETLKPLHVNRRGQVIPTVEFHVEWSEGITHGQSRYAHCDCEACGKRIPSGLVVPVEVTDRKIGIISLWLGRDCATNIFGVKDVGLKREG